MDSQEVPVIWMERVNGNGKPFRQWHATQEWETLPPWGPGESLEACPVCGECYGPQYMDVKGQWHDSVRAYIFHDPIMHKGYKKMGIDATMTLTPPPEPGDA